MATQLRESWRSKANLAQAKILSLTCRGVTPRHSGVYLSRVRVIWFPNAGTHAHCLDQDFTAWGWPSSPKVQSQLCKAVEEEEEEEGRGGGSISVNLAQHTQVKPLYWNTHMQ